MNKRIVLFGENGQLATELRGVLPQGDLIAVGSQECSFENPDAPLFKIRELKPNIIINAAAYTNVENAELESQKAHQINGSTVGVIADEAKKMGISLVHYSTDYVFDGTKNEPYTEEDIVRPINEYGKSKLLGENLISEVDGDHIVLRVSWIYGNHGNNFFKTMLRLGKERKELRIVCDQIGAPTWSRHIAKATAHIIADRDLKYKKGLYHMASGGAVSWFEFAQAIFEKAREHKRDDLVIENVVPILSSEYPSKIRRPKYSVLDSSYINEVFQINLPHWRESLESVCEEEF